MRFEEGDDIVSEGVVRIDEEDAVSGGVRHIFVIVLEMKDETIIHKKVKLQHVRACILNLHA